MRFKFLIIHIIFTKIVYISQNPLCIIVDDISTESFVFNNKIINDSLNKLKLCNYIEIKTKDSNDKKLKKIYNFISNDYTFYNNLFENINVCLNKKEIYDSLIEFELFTPLINKRENIMLVYMRSMSSENCRYYDGSIFYLRKYRNNWKLLFFEVISIS